MSVTKGGNILKLYDSKPHACWKILSGATVVLTSEFQHKATFTHDKPVVVYYW